MQGPVWILRKKDRKRTAASENLPPARLTTETGEREPLSPGSTRKNLQTSFLQTSGISSILLFEYIGDKGARNRPVISRSLNRSERIQKRKGENWVSKGGILRKGTFDRKQRPRSAGFFSKHETPDGRAQDDKGCLFFTISGREKEGGDCQGGGFLAVNQKSNDLGGNGNKGCTEPGAALPFPYARIRRIEGN